MTTRLPAGAAEPAAPLLVWDEWFRRASPAQRAEALALARTQGLLYPHQLPATNGTHASAAPAAEVAPPAALRALLAGKAESLPLCEADPAALEYADADLDAVQRLAVARALMTPDLCLIDGLPGTGKSRVIAELLGQASRRGWRCLFVADAPPALDVVLQRLVGRQDVFALRFTDADEDVATLPAWLRGFTPAEQQQAFLERTLADAREALARAEAIGRRRDDEASLWADLHDQTRRIESLRAELIALSTRLTQVEAEVEREAEVFPQPTKRLPSGPFAAELIALARAHAEAVAALEADEAALREKRSARATELDALAPRRAALAPRCEAKRQGRWWTPAYWSATLSGDALTELATLEQQQAQARDAQAQAEAELQRLAERRAELEAKHTSDRAALVRAETARRRADLADRAAALESERTDLRTHWQARLTALDLGVPVPAEASPESAAYAEALWGKQRERDEQTRRFARQWAEYLEGAGPELAGRLPRLANVLAAPAAALARDPLLNDALDGPLELLVVEEAERLTESELHRLAPLARRLVLVGHAPCEAAAPRPPEKPTRTAGLPALAPACWPRLWQALGGDCARLPYAWHRDGEKLVCRLAPLTEADRTHVEVEPLADASDVELRIVTRPRARPCLAEVAFGADTPVREAFARIVRELDEVPLAAAGRTGWWRAEPDCLVWSCTPAKQPADEYVEVEPGLRVALWADACRGAWRVAAVEFIAEHGWDRSRAAAWLSARLPGRDHGRTVCLQVPHRFARPLAEAVSAIAVPEDSLWPLLSTDGAADGPGLEFVAVPPLRKAELPREGAGLEVDLSAARYADRLPAELAGGLPSRGYANYLEAQALVRRLEQLIAVPEALPAGRRGEPAIAVLALYEGQAELLRRLIDRSEALRAASVPIEVAVPARVRQREFEVVFLSLTRSHAHRHVPFGDDVADLPLALTRARRRLLIFGDPGTLSKRAHWNGPLEHLSTAAALREQTHLRRLLRHVQDGSARAERVVVGR